MSYDTPIFPGAMSPRQMVRNALRYATAVLHCYRCSASTALCQAKNKTFLLTKNAKRVVKSSDLGQNLRY